MEVDANNKALIWQALQKAATKMQGQSLQDLFIADATRARDFSLAAGDLYLDYSKQFITKPILQQLGKLAEYSGVKEAIMRLMQGENVNTTEKRPALHTALRHSSPLFVQEVETAKQKMYAFVEKLQHNQWLGATGRPITDVVNIGIGGSDLGPVMAVEALEGYKQSALRLHFISNIDPASIYSLISQLNPETSLFILSSKSFSTIETLTNANVAKTWLMAHLPEGGSEKHFIAVTTKPEKAIAYGILPDNILTFWDWVGGRYSIWSTIGFPLALSIGVSNFEAFLQGAALLDKHFANAPMLQNMPVILALIGVWYSNFWQASTLAVLPYAQGLRRLPDYLQQLDMESNGKSVSHQGEKVDYTTGPIVWGQAGTNGQHAFYQLLHQGTHLVPIDFILPLTSHTPLQEQHQQLIANCLAQAQALMQGTEGDSAISQHDIMPGNKPSNIILLNKLTPCALGQLLALYEQKVFVQGVIWQINSFDQPGVELGKKMANSLLVCLKTGQLAPGLDPSTRELIEKIRSISS